MCAAHAAVAASASALALASALAALAFIVARGGTAREGKADRMAVDSK